MKIGGTCQKKAKGKLYVAEWFKEALKRMW
jgi:hypothetical protein